MDGMYRGKEVSEYCSDDEELPFEMEPWLGDSDDGSDSSRPCNPLPKILNDDYDDICSDMYDRTCQKRMRFGSLDYDIPILLTSSGERWQFQKAAWLPHCSTNSEIHKSLFSSSYLVPVTDQDTYFEPADGVVDVMRELDIDRRSPLQRDMVTQQAEADISPSSRLSKKSRVSLQTDGDFYVHGKRRLWRIDST